MKTKSIIVFYLILFILGMALAAFPQGIVNDGGYINASSSNYIKFSGSNDSYLISSSADQLILGNVNVDFAGSGTYKLTITDTSFVTVNGSLTLSDSLLLEADTGVMASLITNGTISGSYAIVEQYLKPDQWHMVSSAVTSAQASVYSGIYLMKWNEPDSTWVFIISLTDPLTVTRGYFAWSESSISSPVNVSYSGLLNTGNQTVTGLSYTSGSGKGEGWNLVGNPYPSVLEWNSSWTKTNIDATIYIYDGTQYLTWNYNLGGIGSMGSGNIPASQGFWVKASAASPSMTIPNSERTHQSQQFYKTTDNSDATIMNVKLVGNNYQDELVLGMCSYATNDFDSEFDAWKLFGSAQAPQLYALNADGSMSVDIFSDVTTSKSIALGYRCGVEGICEFHFSGAESFGSGFRVYLEDKAGFSSQDKLYDLMQEPVYKFYSGEGQFENRFVIHFYKVNESNDKLQPKDKSGNISIYSYKKDVFVNNNNDSDGEIIIYTMMGQQLARKELLRKYLNRFNLEFESGYYIIKVVTNDKVESKKIFIN